jgi:hypothetical protein
VLVPYASAALPPQQSASALSNLCHCCWRSPRSPPCCHCCCCWVLVLAHADGAAWVRAALERDLVCRTSCSTCSSVSCWAIICSACASTGLVLQNQDFSLACQEASSLLLPAPVAQPVPLAAAVTAAGAGGGRGGGHLKRIRARARFTRRAKKSKKRRRPGSCS